MILTWLILSANNYCHLKNIMKKMPESFLHSVLEAQTNLSRGEKSRMISIFLLQFQSFNRFSVCFGQLKPLASL